MIDTKKLEKLRTGFGLEHGDMQDIFDTLTAALKVVEAAKYHARTGLGRPELDLALKPFQEEAKK